MKIAFFIRSLHKGGAEMQSILTTSVLSKEFDTRLIVFLNEGDLMPLAQKELGKRLIVLSSENFLKKLVDLFRIFKAEGFDILFNYLPLNNIIGTLIGRAAQIPRIAGGIRGSKIKSNYFKMMIQRFVLNNFSDLIVTNSHKGGEAYVEFGYKSCLIKHIPNAIKIDKEKKIRNEKSRVNILSVGRFIPEKDYLTALKSIEYLLESNLTLPFKYTIIGYGPLKNEIVEAVNEMNLNQVVEIVENPSNISDYYEHADIFLLTSIEEGMPNVLLEAMTNSLPIISTNAGDIEFMISHGQTGFIHNPKDVKSLGDSLKQLIIQGDKRNRFGEKGYQFVKFHFSTKSLLQNYKEIIFLMK